MFVHEVPSCVADPARMDVHRHTNLRACVLPVIERALGRLAAEVRDREKAPRARIPRARTAGKRHLRTRLACAVDLKNARMVAERCCVRLCNHEPDEVELVLAVPARLIHARDQAC